jgi:UDP-N-acetylglucosamine enolpyruvyl transferase
MLTLLGSLLGFISSLVPQFLKIWQDRQDRKQELAIIDRQMEQARLGHQQRLEEINVQADISQSQALYQHDSQLKGSSWVESLRASVRPLITYAFFALFATIKISALYVLIVDQGWSLTTAMPEIWDEETQALFAAVLGFWFGARMVNKPRG